MAWANDQILVDGDMGADAYSEILDMKNIYMIEVYMKYSGTPTGVLQLEFSANGTDWIVPTSASKNLTGSAGSFTVDYIDTPTRYARVHYVYSSGSGTLNVWFSSKGV